MIRKITVVMSFFVMTGCGLVDRLKVAGNANETYRTCIIHEVPSYSASHSASEPTVKKVTEFVVSECRGQEDAYVVAMTDLAMTITGNTVSPEKFLGDEEATLRGDLYDLAASLVEQLL